MTDYHINCLRPLFTDELLKLLQQGISVNLIAQDGQGRKRLLEDIQTARLKNTKVIVVDIKHHLNSYDDLIQTLWQQLDGTTQAPTTWEELIAAINKKYNRTIIVLYHFDDLLDNLSIDSKFNLNFFNQLDKISHNPHISLLCVTSQAHDQSMVCTEGLKRDYSWLDLEKKRLPKLSYDEIQFELKNRNLSLAVEELSQLTWIIHKHTLPYTLLNFLAAKIAHQEDTELVFSERMEKWTKQFDAINRTEDLPLFI
jgi:hypothetical protein